MVGLKSRLGERTEEDSPPCGYCCSAIRIVGRGRNRNEDMIGSLFVGLGNEGACKIVDCDIDVSMSDLDIDIEL